MTLGAVGLVLAAMCALAWAAHALVPAAHSERDPRGRGRVLPLTLSFL